MQGSRVMILVRFLGVIKVTQWGCLRLTHHLGGDFDHGKIMGPEVVLMIGSGLSMQLLRFYATL